MIQITPTIRISENEVKERFIRAPGPGGQKVNKTASAVQLRFDAARSRALSNAVFGRLKSLAGRRMSRKGVLVITANRFSSQELNRKDAFERLVDLIRRASRRPAHRVPTKPSKSSRRRVQQNKRHRGELKRQRGKVGGLD